MPTTRPRHFVTETDDLAVALDAAARRWPNVSRPKLLVRLALEGDHTAQRAHEQQRQRRLAAVRKHSGILTGAYAPDYLHMLEVNELPFPPDSAVRLAKLRASTGLKMPDCCVLLAAADAGATVASFDGRLAHNRSRSARDRGCLRRV